MTGWTVSNGLVEVGVTERCGMLDPVRFTTERGIVEPLHRAPWIDQEGTSDSPLLQNLRGDFFCAPFGPSDLLEGETRPHGATANGRWSLVQRSETSLVLELDTPVAGARVTKTVELRPGQPIVYQRHDFTGGAGALPMGHHAMLHASEVLNLDFSPWVWGGTPPEPVETPATQGRSLLAYPQSFDDLRHVARADGRIVDLSSFPALERSEEIAMLVADARRPFAWSAATAPRAGWVWFGLKDPRVLNGTVLWLSNGGRDYPPFSGRHTRCIGIEEVRGYFHLGHHASLDRNPLSERGLPTTIDLAPDGRVSIRYAFGLVPVPPGFDRVSRIEAEEGQVAISSPRGQTVKTACEVGFVTAPARDPGAQP